MRQYTMEVSKKEEVDGKPQYVKQGEVIIFYPLLSDLGISIEPASYEVEDKDGKMIASTADNAAAWPVYADSKVQMVFDAVTASVKAQARNKLVSGTATLKPGLSIATTVEELMESGGNKGDALAAVREFLAAFKAWLPSTGKAEKVQAAVYNLARSSATVSLQPDDKKVKFAGYLAEFADTLTEVQALRFNRAILNLTEACTAGDALDDM